MALTQSDISELILPGLKAEFSLAYRNELQTDLVGQIATVINTTQPIQRYALMDNAPMMREFIDERRASGLNLSTMNIVDKVFESTIAIDRRAMEDDQLDLIRLRVRDLANRVSHHRHQLVVELLSNGDSTIGYDGTALLSESHRIRNSDYSNLLNDPLTTSALKTATAIMMSIPDNEGVPLGVSPDTLLVGPNQMWNALEIVESPGVSSSSGIINVFQGRLQVVVSPFISGNNWFVLNTKRPMKAVILQQRSDVPVEFSALDQANGSESAFMRDRYYYGVRARYNVGPGLWQNVIGSKVTA